MSEYEIDPFIDDIASELKRPVRFDSSFEARVMASLDPSVSVERKSTTPWILRPRTFYVSPLAGLAVAAGLVAIVTMSVLRTNPNAQGTQVAEIPSSDTEFVLPGPVRNVAAVPALYAAPFTYINHGAKSVAVVGSFNDWDATKNVLVQTADSVWSTNVLLAPGRYEYQLVVDGKWIADPAAQRSADSDFGAANSVMIISPVPR